MKANLIPILSLALAAAFSALFLPAVARPQGDKPKDQPVYTVCTLLAGTRATQPPGTPPKTPRTSDGSTTMVIGQSNPLRTEEMLQMGENVSDLQAKLKTAFQFDDVRAVSSLGDWMPAGREMVIQGRTGEPTLSVTALGVATGTEPPFVAVAPKRGGQAPDYERGYVAAKMSLSSVAEYRVRLTDGNVVILDKTMRVPIGQRTVFARQPAPVGPMYVVVVAAPLPPGGSPREIGAQVVEPNPLIRAPRLLSGGDLVLPPDARAAGLKERIVLTATVGTDGLARDIKVVHPSQGLSERVKAWAVQALKQRRYEPARDGTGTPMEVQIVVTIPVRDGPDEE